LLKFPFEGKVPASYITPDRALAVNSAGRVFQTARVQ
jgi:hypothetical protein